MSISFIPTHLSFSDLFRLFSLRSLFFFSSHKLELNFRLNLMKKRRNDHQLNFNSLKQTKFVLQRKIFILNPSKQGFLTSIYESYRVRHQFNVFSFLQKRRTFFSVTIFLNGPLVDIFL